MVRKLLKSVGLKPELYGLHSIRSGGASLAAALGLPDRLIMCHGGWGSESSKNRYIKETKAALLEVSKSPGKTLRDQRRLNQFKAKRRLSIVGLCRHRSL